MYASQWQVNSEPANQPKNQRRRMGWFYRSASDILQVVDRGDLAAFFLFNLSLYSAADILASMMLLIGGFSCIVSSRGLTTRQLRQGM